MWKTGGLYGQHFSKGIWNDGSIANEDRGHTYFFQSSKCAQLSASVSPSGREGNICLNELNVLEKT